MTRGEHKLYLIYDQQCPACDHYARLVRVRESVGELELVDARTDKRFLPAITARGWDIDEGMVLKVDDELYYADDAIRVLALLSSRSGFFNRLNYHLFASPARARVLYPLLRACRNVLLKLLRRTRINNLGKTGNERF
jgi:predicted DCC family thiol-disulfide oxidoreductase YuxK